MSEGVSAALLAQLTLQDKSVASGMEREGSVLILACNVETEQRAVQCAIEDTY